MPISLPDNRSRRSSDTFHLKLKCSKTFTPSAAQAYKFLSLDAESTNFGLSAYSENVAAYMDMYRYFRVKSIGITVLPLGATPTVPKGAVCIAHLAPGNTADPSTSDDFETMYQVPSTNDPAFNRKLTLNERDLKGIGEWCVTQQDATDEIFDSFGEVWIASETASSTNNISNLFASMFVFLDVHLEFKTLLDPSTISSNLRKTIEKDSPETTTTAK